MDKQYISKLYLTAWQKYYYNLKMGKTDKVQFYTGQCKLLEEYFADYLGTTEEVEALKTKAEGYAEEVLDFYQ